MRSGFVLYGANGFVGEAVARLAVQRGLRPILAGRNAAKIERLASELGLAHRAFDLNDSAAMHAALADALVVLHCAGPFKYTARQMVEGCLRAGAHYLDITGEIPVYEAIAARDAEANAKGVMLLPGVGFDVVPTDCLALHLKQRLPSATHLALAFRTQGPGGLPPGTQRTAIELASYGHRVRRNGRIETVEGSPATCTVDFGYGPVEATQFTWGDVFTAYYSTGIPNIENYVVAAPGLRRQLAMLALLRPMLGLPGVRSLLGLAVKPGPTLEQQTKSFMHVWGKVDDDQGRSAVARLHGPEAGVVWTSRTALAAVQKVLAGNAPPGFQTPARAYGADFVLEGEGVTREDVS